MRRKRKSCGNGQFGLAQSLTGAKKTLFSLHKSK